ncbi:CheR family methyltransferase [Opitutus sp. ER46]|uniref:CheR family methyltransferase n=1 Tax=Opitutus sp. ER46 TaxID=2161864 RepID=UPI000D322F32|nr:CheR family methyltransferase [Opitutus sp. ER46]PTX99101.1 chemotaxis protein CheR [Opitutus sp. ER46]
MTSATVTGERGTDLAISPERFRRVSEFITRELGIRMSDAKIPLLQSRLQRRVRLAGCASLEDYLHLVLTAGEAHVERLEFIDAVTTNKTDFFREPQHFDFLRTVALPALDPDAGRPWTCKVWSAGASTGMEAYTLAMVLGEIGAHRGHGFDFEVLGTDVCRRVLETARAAIYDAADVESVPLELRNKYLLRSRDPGQRQVRIVPELRTRVRFEPLNFMAARYAVREVFDAIFFRNVMIYFDKPTQERVVNLLCEYLRPGGYFFVGHSESVVSLDVPLRTVGSAVYRKR